MKIEEIVRKIQPINKEWIEKARERTAQLAIPPRALGRLHEIAERLCGISGTLTPEVTRRAILVMAAELQRDARAIMHYKRIIARRSLYVPGTAPLPSTLWMDKSWRNFSRNSSLG